MALSAVTQHYSSFVCSEQKQLALGDEGVQHDKIINQQHSEQMMRPKYPHRRKGNQLVCKL